MGTHMSQYSYGGQRTTCRKLVDSSGLSGLMTNVLAKPSISVVQINEKTKLSFSPALPYVNVGGWC